jgi:hypothetical protein
LGAGVAHDWSAPPSTEKDLPINTVPTCNVGVDATAFGVAQNKPNPTDVPVSAVLSDAARPS